MSIAYRHRKNIAKVILVFLALGFLWSVSIKIWSVTLTQNGPEQGMVIRSGEAEHSFSSGPDHLRNGKGAFSVRLSPEIGFFGIAMGIFLWAAGNLCRLNVFGPFCSRKTTLVSLRVRLDN